jgi:putative transcriptional regulator
MKKWRELFAVSQTSLGEKMLISSATVISDYESGRRKSPGAKFIRRFVWALLTIDEEKGSRFIREFAKLTSSPTMAVVDLREFPIPVRVEYLCRAISGEVVSGADKTKEVNGYTVVDARRAVEALSGLEYEQLLGATTERALVFTNVENPALAMMIVRVSHLKPRVVVFHKVKPDEEVLKLAEYEQIPLIFSSAPSIELLVKSLRKLYRIALRIKLGRRVKPPPKISA